jgi:DNA-binding MarR family transcriptional regulator
MTTSHDLHERRVLASLETGRPTSQRTLARELGIALGLTNLLLRKMVGKGWVRLVQVRPNRVLYFVTPAGLAEKAQMTRAYFSRNVDFYRETRDRIRQVFDAVSGNWPADAVAADPHHKRIAFYGADEVAEIGFICLQDTDLTLTAVVDDVPRRQFFGVPVHALSSLDAQSVDAAPFDRLIVMSFDDTEAVRTRILARGVSPERIVLL